MQFPYRRKLSVLCRLELGRSPAFFAAATVTTLITNDFVANYLGDGHAGCTQYPKRSMRCGIRSSSSRRIASACSSIRTPSQTK